MLSCVFNAVRTRRLAAAVRAVASQGDVLFHGTRYPLDILRDQSIRLPTIGDHAVSLTRSAQVAAYWAMMPRDGVPEELPAVLVLDQRLLRSRYRVVPFNDFHSSELYLPSPAVGLADEMEERVVERDINDLNRYLKGLVVFDPTIFQLAALAAAAPGLSIKTLYRRSNTGRSSQPAADAQLKMGF